VKPGSIYNEDTISNDIQLYQGEDHYTNVTDRLGELTINSNTTSESIYLNQQYAPNAYNLPYNRNYNPMYHQQANRPPEMQKPGQFGLAPPAPTYHHENCFCYECKEFRQAGMNDNRLYDPIPYNLPPQMSDNIGKKLNDYLLDRKRSVQHNQGDNIIRQFYISRLLIMQFYFRSQPTSNASPTI
jgi:hypothetical protein